MASKHFEKFRKKTSFSMCGGKKKFKSSEASKMAHRFKQRKYLCPICNGWHLTKQKERYETSQKEQQRAIQQETKEIITDNDDDAPGVGIQHPKDESC